MRKNLDQAREEFENLQKKLGEKEAKAKAAEEAKKAKEQKKKEEEEASKKRAEEEKAAAKAKSLADQQAKQ